jgi:hypothetical protein
MNEYRAAYLTESTGVFQRRMRQSANVGGATAAKAFGMGPYARKNEGRCAFTLTRQLPPRQGL